MHFTREAECADSDHLINCACDVHVMIRTVIGFRLANSVLFVTSGSFLGKDIKYLDK